MSDPKPKTDAGRRLLWMLNPRYHDGHPVKAFDAMLTRRIVEDFIPRIEAQAQLGEFVQDDDLPTADDVLGILKEPT